MQEGLAGQKDTGEAARDRLRVSTWGGALFWAGLAAAMVATALRGWAEVHRAPGWLPRGFGFIAGGFVCTAWSGIWLWLAGDAVSRRRHLAPAIVFALWLFVWRAFVPWGGSDMVFFWYGVAYAASVVGGVLLGMYYRDLRQTARGSPTAN